MVINITEFINYSVLKVVKHFLTEVKVEITYYFLQCKYSSKEYCEFKCYMYAEAIAMDKILSFCIIHVSK